IDAEKALQKLNGTAIGKHTVRLSWGRNPANKQAKISIFLLYRIYLKLLLL
ncbi:Polyadenylate-binding protein rbp47c', partial [Datura stramonium]|nr:Polyadenylate-binding protein rbp47c' [Datura stramonium]